MRNGIRVTICLMVIVTVLAMSLSVFADNVSPSPVPTLDPSVPNSDLLWQNAGNYGMWLMLKSWGIEISESTVEGYTQAVADTLTDLVMEYLDSLPSPVSIYVWTNPWLWDTDFWGNMRYNSSMLEDVQAFAEWLGNKFSLINNSETVINPIYQLNNGYTLYEFNRWYEADRWSGDVAYIYMEYFSQDGQTPPPFYFVWHNTNNNYVYIVALSRTSFSFYGGMRLSDNTVDDYYYLSQATYNGQQHLRAGPYGNDTSPYYVCDVRFSDYYPRYADYIACTPAELVSFLNVATIQEVGDVKFITGTILLPEDNPDYSSGDSITIIGDDTEYGVIEWDGTVSVNNLPAIVSTGTVSNPRLDTFWGFIPVLAEQTKDAIVLTRGLIYELPEELVVTFYAVMGGLILFGVIKLMREH